jgi:Fur family peroxide stress response transcriptional regulator
MKRMRQIETRSLIATLEQNGFRMTPQREHVYRVLISKPDHPTADEVFMRAKKDMPEISMATVYNTLDALVASKLVRLVNHDRGATRYCPNMQPHHHFYCDACGAAYDLDETEVRAPRVEIPRGFQVDRLEIVVRGRCPKCAGEGARR